MDKTIAIRYGAGAAGVAAGTPRAAVEIRQGSPTGTLLQTIPLNATGTANNEAHLRDDVGQPELHGLAASVHGVPDGHGRADHQHRQHQRGSSFSGPGVTP